MLDSECNERTEIAESERRGVLIGGFKEIKPVLVIANSSPHSKTLAQRLQAQSLPSTKLSCSICSSTLPSCIELPPEVARLTAACPSQQLGTLHHAQRQDRHHSGLTC